MSWRCKLFQSWEEAEKHYGTFRVPIGTMWFSPDYREHPDFLSSHYHEQWADKRDPLFVCLPGGVDFCVDSRPTMQSHRQNGGWNVTGDLPDLLNITVSPSILIGGGYHGYIRDGVVTDDVDGKTFPEIA